MQRTSFHTRLTIAAALALTACGDDVTSTDSDTDTDTESTTGTTEPTASTTRGDDTTATTEAVDSSGSTTDTETADVTGSSGDSSSSSTGDTMGVCGDGMLDDGEACDDGNDDVDDGCDDACEVEEGFSCDDAEPSVCAAACGDGMIVDDEECDDSGTEAGDGCSDTCTVEMGWACDMEPSVCTTNCGDGEVAGMEACDDGDNDGDDGCSARCTVEDGWECTGSPSVCDTDCGDGLVAGDEECDDMDTEPGDGCDATCVVEPGFECDGEPSVCQAACGDGVLSGAEVCDDGNISQGDGCSEACQVEFAWTCTGDPSTCTLSELYDDVALGGGGGCLLTQSGLVGCFGSNSDGQIGNPLSDDALLPVQATDAASQISSGEDFNCAIRNAGEVWCWGDNDNSQIGPSATAPNDQADPVQVTGITGAVAVELGDEHACAIDGTGAVLCWGDNSNRQLGQGDSTTDSGTPLIVPMPGDLAAVDLGLGADHSCAVLSDGSAACWGDDDNGQLGDGTEGSDNGTPALVAGVPALLDIEAHGDTTCGLAEDGSLGCWGDNADGQVGDGTTDDTATAAQVFGSGIDAVSVGEQFTCAVNSDDEVFCWGEGADFQLGNGDLFEQPTPVAVLEVPPGDIVDIETGERGSCIEYATDERWCWGFSELGELGLAPRNQLGVTEPLEFSAPLVQLELADPEYRGVLCGVLDDGTVECSGEGTIVSFSQSTGAAGLFTTITRHLAQLTPIDGLTGVLEIAMGDGAACVRTATDVQCWGDGAQLQLGQGAATADLETPTVVAGLGVVDEIEAGSQFFCARTGGTVQCWGDSSGQQVGVAGTTDQGAPVTIMGLDDATDIELGDGHGCALRSTGVVSCWGEDDAGQLGDDDGDGADSVMPVDAMLPGMATEIALGQDHGCALVDGDVYCWGENGRGQLGQGDEIDSDLPLIVPGLGTVVDIESSWNFSCAVEDTGDMWCWGYGLDGQLGEGGEDVTGLTDYLEPVLFEAATGITDVTSGNSATCVDAGAGWQCVGFRASGQLGDGSTLEPTVPQPMLFGL